MLCYVFCPLQLVYAKRDLLKRHGCFSFRGRMALSRDPEEVVDLPDGKGDIQKGAFFLMT